MNENIKQANFGVTDQQPWPVSQSSISDSTSRKPPGRPLIPLLLVVLGVLLYFTGWSITYMPGVIPIMIAISATMWGPMCCVLLLAL